MVSNKEYIIKEILAKNLNKLEEYTEIVNNGKTFFTKNVYDIIEGVPQ